MNNEIKVLYCGECTLFLNECTDGSGQCKITKETCSCGDSCELEFLNKKLLAEQAKNKKLVEALEKIAYRDITIKSNFYSSTVANEALNEVNK